MGFLKQIIQLLMSGRHGGYGRMGGRHGGSKHGGYGSFPAGYPPLPGAAARTGVCPKCGTPNPASARFCAECGASLAGGPCSACGAELEPGAKFCGRCGKGQ